MAAKSIKKYLKDKELLIVFIVVVVFFSLLSDRFLSGENIENILRNTSLTGVLALGFALVMINGDFDLSFASTVGLLNLIGLMIIDRGFNIWFVFILMIVGGVLWELINAFFIVKLKMHAFIVTIATWRLSKGFIYWINKGRTFYGDYPENLKVIGRESIGIMPISAFIFIVVAVFIFLLANRTKFGRHLYAVGSNTDAAEYVGISATKHRIISYIMLGCCVGIAAIMLCSRLNSAPASAGEGYQMTVIASAFLGATVFKPGLVNIGGSILAILLLTVIDNGLIMVNVPFYFKYIVEAFIILGAVTTIVKKSKGEGPSIF